MKYTGIYPVPGVHAHSRNCNVCIGTENVIAEVTDCPIRFRVWKNERIVQGGNENSVFGLVVKTKTFRNKKKAVVCAFITGTTCLILKLDKNAKTLINAVSEFLLTPGFTFTGVDIQTSIDVLLDGIRVDSQPVIFDLNREAARSYKMPNLMLANLNGLLMHIMQDYAHYPGVVDDRYDRQTLYDGQIAAISIDAYSALQLHRSILARDAAQAAANGVKGQPSGGHSGRGQGKHDRANEIKTEVNRAKKIKTEADGAKKIKTEVDGAKKIKIEVDGANKIKTEADGAKKIKTEVDGANKIKTEVDGANKIKKVVDGANKIKTEADGAKKIKTEADGAKKIKTEADGAKKINTEVDGANKIKTEVDGAKKIKAEVDAAGL